MHTQQECAVCTCWQTPQHHTTVHACYVYNCETQYICSVIVGGPSSPPPHTQCMCHISRTYRPGLSLPLDVNNLATPPESLYIQHRLTINDHSTDRMSTHNDWMTGARIMRITSRLWCELIWILTVRPHTSFAPNRPTRIQLYICICLPILRWCTQKWKKTSLNNVTDCWDDMLLCMWLCK